MVGVARLQKYCIINAGPAAEKGKRNSDKSIAGEKGDADRHALGGLKVGRLGIS